MYGDLLTLINRKQLWSEFIIKEKDPTVITAESFSSEIYKTTVTSPVNIMFPESAHF